MELFECKPFFFWGGGGIFVLHFLLHLSKMACLQVGDYMMNIDAKSLTLNPSNAKANCHQKNKDVTFFGNHLNISNEHPYAKVSIIFQFFCIILYWPN